MDLGEGLAQKEQSLVLDQGRLAGMVKGSMIKRPYKVNRSSKVDAIIISDLLELGNSPIYRA